MIQPNRANLIWKKKKKKKKRLKDITKGSLKGPQNDLKKKQN